MGIKIVATATAGTAIHTAPTDTAQFDEVWLWAVNTDTVNRTLTVEFGGATSPDNLIIYTIPPKSGPVLVCPGLILKGNATPKTVKAFADAANIFVINGYVHNLA
jgi:hypothetical protein